MSEVDRGDRHDRLRHMESIAVESLDDEVADRGVPKRSVVDADGTAGGVGVGVGHGW